MIPRVRQVDYSAFMHSYGSSGAICLVARVTWAAGGIFTYVFTFTFMFCLCFGKHVLAISIPGIQCFRRFFFAPAWRVGN